MKKNKIFVIGKITILLSLFTMSLMASESKMQVFQPPNSSCPKSWFIDMEKLVDKVDVITLMSVKSLKKDIGIAKEIQSCNTSLMDDYVFEGNVPLQAIKDFLVNKPSNSIGLALPAYENDRNPKTVYVIFEDKSYKKFGMY